MKITPMEPAGRTLAENFAANTSSRSQAVHAGGHLDHSQERSDNRHLTRQRESRGRLLQPRQCTGGRL